MAQQPKNSLRVSYLEGQLEAQTPAGWKSLDCGDEVSATASLRLGTNSAALLEQGNISITLRAPGIYALEKLWIEWKTRGDWKQGVAGKLLKLTGQNAGRTDSAAMGVRGDYADSKEPTRLDHYEILIERGRELLQKRDWQEAQKSLAEVLELTAPDREQEVLDLLGLGALVRAEDSWDKARYQEALSAVQKGLEWNPSAEIKQPLYYLEALCYGALKDPSAQKKSYDLYLSLEPVLEPGPK